MKLSEAMRLGAMIRPQAFGGYMVRKGAEYHSCVLGAAIEAANSGLAAWPWLKSWKYHPFCPACAGGDQSGDAYSIIVHLNDRHRWTRERIADWVATIEPAEEVAAEPAQQEVLCEVK